MDIIIAGAGRTGSTLAKLLDRDHKVTIIDRDKDVCRNVSAEIRGTVINRNCIEPELIEELNIPKRDVFIAVTGDDRANFLAAIYAKQKGARRVVARVSEPAYGAMLAKLGIETIIPELTIAEKLAIDVTRPAVYELVTLGRSNFDILEFEVSTKWSGRRISELPECEGCEFIAIFRAGKFILPDNVPLLMGDKIIVMCEIPAVKRVQKVLG